MDDFLSGKETEETFNLDLSEEPEHVLEASEEDNGFSGLTFDEKSEEEESLISEEESALDFTLDSSPEEQEGFEFDLRTGQESLHPDKINSKTTLYAFSDRRHGEFTVLV